MTHSLTFYHVLGVQPDVTSAEIKRAYRKLVKSYHPDVDHHEQTAEQKSQSTEQMLRLNEAYETLMDNSKRAAYDRIIGLYRTASIISRSQDSVDEDLQKQRYLKQVYNPARQAVMRVLTAYQKQLRKLSLDIFDDELLADFEVYVNQVESALLEASQTLSLEPWPPILNAAVQMMRYSIAHAADGLEEMRHFLSNFDYAHLSMTSSLFRIASDLARESLRLTHV